MQNKQTQSGQNNWQWITILVSTRREMQWTFSWLSQKQTAFWKINVWKGEGQICYSPNNFICVALFGNMGILNKWKLTRFLFMLYIWSLFVKQTKSNYSLLSCSKTFWVWAHLYICLAWRCSQRNGVTVCAKYCNFQLFLVRFLGRIGKLTVLT
jgi:hypothetical protein